jgi:predicted nucleic acid-binding protein
VPGPQGGVLHFTLRGKAPLSFTKNASAIHLPSKGRGHSGIFRKAKSRNCAIVESFISAFEIIAFNEVSCKIYARIRASLEKSGAHIGPMDLLIASIGLTHNFTLVTNNVKEFRRIKGLKLENWT